MKLGSLLPAGRLRRIFRPERLPVLVHFLFFVSTGILWYLGATLGQVYGVAFLGVAMAWTAAILPIEYSVASTAYQQWKERKAKREAAYDEFLTLADQYAKAWDDFSELDAAQQSAVNDRAAAKKSFDRDNSPENLSALNSAETRAVTASKALKQATATTGKLKDEYEQSKACAEQLAAKTVRSALAEFDQSITREASVRGSARSSFLKAVQADLGQRNWPGKHLPHTYQSAA
ncbi:MAG TPA: hypothetical protein VHZ03_37050 [Trebonia sp.]|jgi:hypothetical protein|nr:hypothetical protein [Trebonia sp.]